LPSPGFPVLATLQTASNDLLRYRIVYGELNLRLGKNSNAVLGAAIKLGMTHSNSIPVNFVTVTPWMPNIRHRLPNFIHFERLDHCGDELSCIYPPGAV